MFGRNFLEVASSYHSMSAMTNAGIGIFSALEFQAKSGSQPELARRLLTRVRKGSSLANAMRSEGFGKLDIALVRAGEETGNLVTVFSQLFDYYQDRHNIERTIKFALLKPALLFFVSITTAAFVPYFLGRIGLLGFLARTVLPMGIVLAIAFWAFDFFWRASREGKYDSVMARFQPVMILAASMAKERFFVAFLICVRAGASIDVMFSVFRDVADHPSMRGALLAFNQLAERKGLADALASSGVFTDDEIRGIRVGEFTGRLEQQLDVIVRELRSVVQTNLAHFTDWAPRVLYGLIGAFVILNMFL